MNPRFRKAPLTRVQTEQDDAGTVVTQADQNKLPNRVAVEVVYQASTAHVQGSTIDGVLKVGWVSGITLTSDSRELQPGESWRFDADVAVDVFVVANFDAQRYAITQWRR